eukprot:COSAG06_NODE_50553_length_318_cov_0.552511_2_plen_61_part_01
MSQRQKQRNSTGRANGGWWLRESHGSGLLLLAHLGLLRLEQPFVVLALALHLAPELAQLAA